MLVDDQEMIRTGLRTILDATDDLEVVAEAADGIEAIQRLDPAAVDVVLMDLRMPGIDGVETTRRIRARHSPDAIRILVLTTFEEDHNVLAALRAGANGFLSKGVGPAELATGIREVAEGGGALSAAAAAVLIDNVAEERAPVVDAGMVDRFEALTARERDVVRAIVTGLDNAQIAAQLFVSPYTVKTHANRAMAKVGARDRAQLVVFAVRAGYLSPETAS
ncbi:response regulator transcription factor [Agromyces seonyuensis]|nr:response regulator transcription factor [Agromyces seonyuensis]